MKEVIQLSVNFEYYKAFYYVAKYQNITHAANELCLTQPSVSKTIQNLEWQLDCQLFIRTKRGVRLTPEGNLLFQRILPACQMIFAAEEEINRVKSLDAGIVRISANDLAVKFILLPILEKYRELHPHVTIVINRIPPANAAVALNTGAIDMFLDFDVDVNKVQDDVWGNISTIDTSVIRSSEVNKQVVDTFHDVPIVGPKLAFLVDSEISLQTLFEYPLIIPRTDTFSRDFYKALFGKNGHNGKVDMEVSGVERRILLTKNNFGISFLPIECVENEIQNGTIFPLRLQEKLLERQMILMTSKKRPLSLAAKSFIEMLCLDRQKENKP
jgi:DNA-binding transcriptional LysR family regulator